jgi:thermitase
LIVGFDPGTTTADRLDALQDADAEADATPIPHLRATAVEVPAGQSAEVIRDLRADDDVSFVVADSPVHALWSPNDPFLVDQYALDVANFTSAWDTARGAGVTIAIVDTGIEQGEVEFSGRVVAGHDFVNNDSDPEDDYGHGTHVAGIAAASANNLIGVAGAAPEASIMPIKVLASDGFGNTSDIAAGITWAADHGAQIINLSLGGSSDSGNLMKNALAYAKAHGVQAFCAAGNQGVPQLLYPARLEDCVSVAATDSGDDLASFSNYGTGLDVASPGAGILSTLMGAGYDYWDGTSMATPYVAGLAALLVSSGVDVADLQTHIQNSATDLGAAGYDTSFGWGRIDAGGAFGMPICEPVPMSVTEDTPTDVAPDCTDPEGAPMTYAITAQPSTQGTASVTGGGNLHFVPANNSTAPATFTYTATDADDHISVPRTVTVTMTGTPDTPVAADDARSSLPNNSQVDINVLANDSDPDGALSPAATVTVTAQPAHGNAIVSARHVLVTPAYGYLGTDSLTYRVCDTTPLCDVATVALTWVEGNDAPSAPTNIVATSPLYTSSGQAHLSWTAAVDPDTGDHIEQYVVSSAPTANGPWTERLTTSEPNAEILGLHPAVAMWFRVRAIDSFGEAGPESTATSVALPKAPTKLVITQRAPSGSARTCGRLARKPCVYRSRTLVRLRGNFDRSKLHRRNAITVRLSHIERGKWRLRLVKHIRSTAAGTFATSVRGRSLKRGKWKVSVIYSGSSTTLPAVSAGSYFTVR